MLNSSNSQRNIVILGGGIPGIFSALYLNKLKPECNIYLIESDKKIGGLYNSFEDKDGGIFDKGMHLIYETCIWSVLKTCSFFFSEMSYKSSVFANLAILIERKTNSVVWSHWKTF